MSSFGMNSPANRRSPRHMDMSYNQRPRNGGYGGGPTQMYDIDLEMSETSPPPHHRNGGGMTNLGYHGSSIDDVSRPHVSMRQSQNGHHNRAFIPSTISDDGFSGYPSGNNNTSPIPVYTIPTKDGISHDTNRYKTNDNDDRRDRADKGGCCTRTRCVASIIGLVLLLGVATFVALYFATDLIRDRTAVTTVTPSTENALAPPIPDGDMFSGEVRLNRDFSVELEDPNSEAFKNVSAEFSNFMDREMSSNPLLSSSYNRTEILSLQSGSIRIIFIIWFNVPVVREQVFTEITIVFRSSPPSSLQVIVESLVITDFVESVACMSEDLILCDGVCRDRAAIACDTHKNCSDWYDEFNCTGESVSCDFEQPNNCGYIAHQNNAHVYKWIYNSGDTASLDTGPLYDHTYMNDSGHYFYTEWCQRCTHSDKAKLSSPWYVSREPSCLSFYYNMKGHPTEMGPFYVSSTDENSNEKLIYTRENPDALDKTGVWRQVKLDIPAGSHRFTFASLFNDASELGDKAIDDILIESGACPRPPACDDTLYCPITNECLLNSSKPLCNGKFECPDESDEKDCPDTQYSCSFESGRQLSTYSLTTESPTDPLYQWLITSSPTPVTVQGTYIDNTYKNDLGHYITVLPGQILENTEAKLRIEQLFSDNQERCLQFAFNMNHEGAASNTPGTLKVQTKKADNGEMVVLWSNEENAGRSWVHVSYSLPALNKSYYIEFVAVRGNGDGIVTSLDDITVMNGFCKCDDPSRRQCPDRTCIPEEWFCDGDPDCENGEDEVNCAVCDIDEFQCKDRSCVPGGEGIRCDGTYDCADGTDEDSCATIDQCATEDCIKLRHTNGLYEVCSSDWDLSLNSQVCKYLYKGAPVSTGATDPSPTSSQFLQLTNPSSGGFISRFTKVNSCPTNQVIKILCEEETCGRRHHSLTPYIIGGVETTQQGRWPWQVELKFVGLHTCGATLLTPNWIITAAHCVSGIRENSPQTLTVSLGTTQTNPGQEQSVVRTVKRVKLHPKYVNVYGGYDIAMLFIEQAINYTDIIRPACISTDEDSFDSRSRCFLTGWGKIDTSGRYPDNLQEAKYKLMSSDSCNTSWSGVIQDNMVCAGYKSGTIRSCQGDSGGPLVCLDKYRRWSLVGITSFGPPGCLLENHREDVFTRVSEFNDWITETINFEFSCTNGRKILDEERLCDRVDDCGDNSDEVLPCTRTVQCDFESKNYCGYTLGGWSNGTGLASSNGPLTNTGPSFDHTSGLADGSHTYMFTSVDKSILTSPDHINGSSVTCLQLSYFISYDSKIKLYKSSTSGDLLATISGAADVWQTFQVSLPIGSYSLVFEADISQASYVAVDDLTVRAGACSVSTTCPSGTFTCLSDSVCIRSALKCDGVSHCPDSSDESNCREAIDQVTCSFDEPFACGFTQSNSDDFNWLFQYGFTDSNTRPSEGHKDGINEVDVSYMVARPSKAYAKATIHWPLKLSATYCMTFWYYMFGDDVGSLSVMSDNNLLWREFGSQGDEWVRIRVPIQAGKTVEITSQSGLMNNQSNANSAAIDDITVVKGGCPAEAGCDPATELQCSGKCVNVTKRCDRDVDCYDMSDESSCGWTVDCDFSSSCDSYRTTTNFGSYIWTRADEGYLTANASNADRSSTTEYISAPFSLSETSCLRFKYLVDGGEVGNPDLSVILKESTINRRTPIWSSSLNRPSWTEAHVTLTSNDQSPLALIFQALYGGNRSALLMLDDIRLTTGACSLPACSGQFLCPYEESCIPTSSICDGINDCHAGIDELNCGELAQHIDCDFDVDLCQWEETRSDSFRLSLMRWAGSTPLLDTGPSFDHTQRNLIGNYIYLQSTNVPGQAQLVSPSVRLPSQHCFKFYYYMTGASLGYLNLTGVDSSGSRQLMTLFGAQGLLMWHKAQITLNSTDDLRLQFDFSSRGLWSNTAIDDITLRPGPCDCSAEDFHCSGSGECFDKAVQCDQRFQCVDKSDEQNCGCPNDDFRCTDGSCHPVDIICADPLLRSCPAADQVLDCACNSTFEQSCPQGFCIDVYQFCDGEINCPDESDEPPRCAENCPEEHLACDDMSLCIPNSFYCDLRNDCPDGSDEKEGCVPVTSGATFLPPISDCSSNNFVCRDHSQVLSRSRYCDGQVDCADSSDEPPICECCPATEFSCESGHRCINSTLLCNGVYDCTDLSDELSCNCTASEFACDGGLCLSSSRICDGVIDCNDWMDETSCNCSETQTRCDNGRCIDNSLKCNRRDDCLDNSDEFDCLCSSTEMKCEATTDRRCLPLSWECDGFKDCHNATDEAQCGSCPEYMCTDFTCISYAEVCDGIAQCSDNKDEKHCFSQAENQVVNVLLSDGSSVRNHTICYDDWDMNWSSSLCVELGYDFSLSTRIIPTAQLHGPWVKLNHTSGALRLSQFERVASCASSFALVLNCQSQVCGASTKLNISPYIVGGDLVTGSSAWPWMMPIYYAGEFSGAGVHLGDGWVLTAGHLARVQRISGGLRYIERRDAAPHLFQVEMSSLERNRSSGYLNVSRVMVHADFTLTPTLRHDIALLKVNSDLRYPSVCLYNNRAPEEESLCYVAGWGSVDGRDEEVERLRDVRMNVLPDTQCVADWNSGGFNIFYSSTMMCAGGDNLPSTCYGDSGGPLMCMNSQTGRWAIKGIVSFGERNCVLEHKANVFTEVAFYKNWIQQIVEAGSQI